jgi:ATPase subunit of ABC transporter with duplicated ATPase domains
VPTLSCFSCDPLKSLSPDIDIEYMYCSTLLRIIAAHQGETVTSHLSAQITSGELYLHPSLRLAYYQQHQADTLPLEVSPLLYLTDLAHRSTAPSPTAPETSSHNEQTLRSHLGSFGLSGDLALQPMGSLSGGQRSRVVLAALTLQK